MPIHGLYSAGAFDM